MGISGNHDDRDDDERRIIAVPASPAKVRVARQILALLTAEVSDQLGCVVIQLHEEALWQLVGAARLIRGEDVRACISGGRLYAAYVLRPRYGDGAAGPWVWLNAEVIAEIASAPAVVLQLVIAVAAAITAYSAAAAIG